jgi:hypothetical protein
VTGEEDVFLERAPKVERMPIRVKAAKTDAEIDDALWVRHEVFIIEDAKFGGKPLPHERLIDRFDGFPSTHNIVAYDGDEPVATMRLVKETKYGLPADSLYDFSDFRRQVTEEMRRATNGSEEARVPVFGSAGMLAIRGPWRRKRSVIRAMCKMAATVCHQSDATHILVAVNHETASMYKRLSFEPLSDKVWVERVGNYVVPLATPAERFVAWAFGAIPDTPLGGFKDSFERVVVLAGNELFRQGDTGRHAYIIETGTIRIVRCTPEGAEITLAHLGRGALFGELALIDEEPRSATAVASTDAELISLDRESFWEQVSSNPVPLRDVLKLLSTRIRALDDMVMVHAFAPAPRRLEFALKVAKVQTVPDRKDERNLIFHGGPAAIASSAAVGIEEARSFLDDCSAQGLLEYTSRNIRFLHPPTAKHA